MRGKSREVHNSLGMPLPLLNLFPFCDHQRQPSSPGQDLVTPCHGVPVPPLCSHLAHNTQLALPFPPKMEKGRQKDIQGGGHFQDLSAAWFVAGF